MRKQKLQDSEKRRIDKNRGFTKRRVMRKGRGYEKRKDMIKRVQETKGKEIREDKRNREKERIG